MGEPGAMLALAAAAGLAGSVHCVAMCGGIAGFGAAAAGARPRRPLGLALLFHGGRILSYALVGAGLAFGARGAATLAPGPLEGTGRIVAAVFMAALAARILLNRDFLGVERAGAHVFRWLAPLWRQLLRVPGLLRQLTLGAVWGLMPCGLVYSMLAVAAAPGEPLLAMAAMAAFGLGTVPALIAVTASASRAQSWLAGSSRVRVAAGALVLACALWTGIGAALHFSPGAMAHSGHVAHISGAGAGSGP